MIVLDGNSHSLQLITTPSRRIFDGAWISSNQDLVLSYAPDPDEIISGIDPQSDLAIFHYDGEDEIFSSTPNQVLATNQPTNNSVYDFNAFFQLTPVNPSSALVSKKDQIVKLFHDGNAYDHIQLIEAEGNYFYKGISTTTGSYIVNTVGSGLEYFNANFEHDIIPMGYPVYRIVPNASGDKLYMFHTLNSDNTGLYVYSEVPNTAININQDPYNDNDLPGQIGDVVYNPYQNHFLVSLSKSDNDQPVIKVINDNSSNSAYGEIPLSGVQYPKEIYIGPDRKLYVMANMKYGLTPKIMVYTADDNGQMPLYEHLFTDDIEFPVTSPDVFEYYSADFCYNNQDETMYASIHLTEYTLDSYVSVTNTMFDYWEPFDASGTGLLFKIENQAVVNVKETLYYPAKIICPDNLSGTAPSQYQNKMFVLGKDLFEYDYQNALLSGTHAKHYNDICYSPDHDMLFAIADIGLDPENESDRSIRIDKIYYDNGSLVFDDLITYPGQASGIFYNNHDRHVYIHYKFDNENLGGSNVSLLKFNPSVTIEDLTEIDLDMTSFYPELDHGPDYHYFMYNLTQPYINPYNNSIYVPNGGFSCVSKEPFEPHEVLDLNGEDKGGITWLSFPRLDEQYMLAVDALTGRIDPALSYNEGDYGEMEGRNENQTQPIYIDWNREIQQWIPLENFELHSVNCQAGYTLPLKYENLPQEGTLDLYGSLLNPNATIDQLYANRENWIGYWLVEPQHPLDAFYDHLGQVTNLIKGQDWFCFYWLECGLKSNGNGHHPCWECSDNAQLNYGDMVKVIPDNDIFNFYYNWTGYAAATEEPPTTTYYTYEEQTDYTALVIELDSAENPVEIGAFVNDTCIGSEVVQPDDSLCLLQAYTEGAVGEITFQQYYGSSKSAPRSIKEYRVLNTNTMVQEKRKINTNEKRPLYFISFKDAKVEQSIIQSPAYLHCRPNPFNSVCHIEYFIPETGIVTIEALDLYGRVVNTIESVEKNPGNYSLQWHVEGNAEGIYIIRLSAKQLVLTQKIVYVH